MSTKRAAVVVVLLVGIFAIVPAGAVPARSEMRSYIGGYSTIGFVCGEYGAYDLGDASVDAHTDVGSACFDVQSETRVAVSLSDVTGTNVSGYYQFNGCDNCGCYWCPVIDDGRPGRFVDTGTWGFFCNDVVLDIPAGANELEIIVLVDGCDSAVPPTMGSVTAEFFG